MDIREDLARVYEEIMWLSARPNVTPSVARSWYTHATSERLKKHVRRFTGFASQRSVESDEDLRLEHYLRIQSQLTKLVQSHKEKGTNCPDAFVELILECEQVHIATKAENYAAMKAKGDYSLAGISLVAWEDIDPERRRFLWRRMLRGRVSNYKKYDPDVA